MQQDSTPKTRFIDRLPYKTIAAVVVTGVVCTAGSATAASLTTSAQIQDQTILNRDIHPGTISESRLGEALRAKLNRMTAQSGKGSGPGRAASTATVRRATVGQRTAPRVTAATRATAAPTAATARSSPPGSS